MHVTRDITGAGALCQVSISALHVSIWSGVLAVCTSNGLQSGAGREEKEKIWACAQQSAKHHPPQVSFRTLHIKALH